MISLFFIIFRMLKRKAIMITKEKALNAIREAHPEFTDTYIMNFLNRRMYETLWEGNSWSEEDIVDEFEEWYEYKNGRGSI